MNLSTPHTAAVPAVLREQHQALALSAAWDIVFSALCHVGKLTLLLQHDSLLKRTSVCEVHLRVFTKMISCFPSRKKTEPLCGEEDRLSTVNELISSAAMATGVICWNAHFSTRPLEAPGNLSSTDRGVCWCTGGLSVLRNLDPRAWKGVKIFLCVACKHKYVIQGFKHAAYLNSSTKRQRSRDDRHVQFT